MTYLRAMKSSLIAIGGISRSGKSTLANQLATRLNQAGQHCSVVSQDDFCLPSTMLPTIHGMPDWEQPESVDWDRLYEHIYQGLKTHPYVIVEGLFVFDDPRYRTRYDLEIVLEIDYNTFMSRRNVEQRWGKEPDWYIHYVWEAYQKRNPKPRNGITYSGTRPIDLEPIFKRIFRDST